MALDDDKYFLGNLCEAHRLRPFSGLGRENNLRQSYGLWGLQSVLK